MQRVNLFYVPLNRSIIYFLLSLQAGAIIALIFYIIILVALGHYIVADELLSIIIGLIGLLVTTEIITHIVFIVGAHMVSFTHLHTNEKVCLSATCSG